MKFNVQSKLLLSRLNAVSKVVSNKNAYAILDNFQLRYNAGAHVFLKLPLAFFNLFKCRFRLLLNRLQLQLRDGNLLRCRFGLFNRRNRLSLRRVRHLPIGKIHRHRRQRVRRRYHQHQPCRHKLCLLRLLM